MSANAAPAIIERAVEGVVLPAGWGVPDWIEPGDHVFGRQHPQVRESACFLKALFKHYPEGCGYVEIRCLPKIRAGGGIARNWFKIEEVHAPERLLSMGVHCANMSREYDVYVGVLPRRERGTGSAKDVRAAGCLWADLDEKNGMDQHLCLQAASEADILVRTGHGYHAYWLSSTVVPINEVTAGRFRQKLMAHQGRVKAADMTADLPRVLRVAGCWNHKDVDNPLPVRLMRYPK